MPLSDFWTVTWQNNSLYYSDIFQASTFIDLIKQFKKFKHSATIVRIDRMENKAITEIERCLDFIVEERR